MGQSARDGKKNLRVVKVDTDENLLLVFGSVPGARGHLHFDPQNRGRRK